MKFLGHFSLSEEGTALIELVLMIGAITVVAFVVWVVKNIVQAFRKPTDSTQVHKPKSERDK